MRKIRDVLRLRLSAGLSIREISRSTKISVGGIAKLLAKAKTLELSWPLPDDLDDNKLANLFYPAADTRASRRYQMPDWRGDTSGTQTTSHDQAVAVGGVHPAISEPLLQLFPILRSLPALARQAEALHAPTPSSR